MPRIPLHRGFGFSLLLWAGAAPLAAAPLILTPLSDTITSSHSFDGTSRQDQFVFEKPVPVVETGVTGSYIWDVQTNGVFTYTPGVGYSTAFMVFTIPYDGGMKDSEGQTTVLDYSTSGKLTFYGLQGVTEEELGTSLTVNNSGAQLTLSRNVLNFAQAFSFSGFRMEVTLPDGEHSVNLTGTSLAAVTGLGYGSPVDLGAFLEYQAVPEPSSLVLLAGAGALGMAWRLRSRRRTDKGVA